MGSRRRRSAIGVAAKDGVVTLTGYIDSYVGKLQAERVAKRVAGVRAVANDIMVRQLVDRTDADIARDAAQALELKPAIAENVQAVVHQGHVTLTGTVPWAFEKQQAENAVRRVRGIRGVLNYIAVKPSAGQRDVRRRIMRALHRHADLDARHIRVTVADGLVTLSGTVRSWTQRELAEQAAATAVGVERVDNEIVVAPSNPFGIEPPDELC